MPDEPTDGQLLGAFVDSGKQEPFERLLTRHAGLVYNVCQRILPPADAEDAAQAVFLTLLHKAKSLRSRASIAGWLHHVAWHVAMRAREAAAVRAAHEQKASAMTATITADREWEALRPLIDSELDALPEKYRLPIILHHLEGRTKEETAVLLNSNSGTVSGRLARGRELLRHRLGRKGIALSVIALAALLTEKTSAAAIPPTLVMSTSKAAMLIAAGKAAAGGSISAQSAALTQGSLRMFYLAKLKLAAAAIVLLAMTISLGVCAHFALADVQGAASPPKPGGWGAPVNGQPGGAPGNPGPGNPGPGNPGPGGGMSGPGGNPFGGPGGGGGAGGSFIRSTTQPTLTGQVGIPGKFVKSDQPDTLILESRLPGASLFTHAILVLDKQTEITIDEKPVTLADIEPGTFLIATLNISKDGSYKVLKVAPMANSVQKSPANGL